MFFVTSDKVASIPVKEGVKVIIIRMRNIPALDISALQALEEVYCMCKKKCIRMLFSHVNEQPMSVMEKAGFFDTVGSENFLPNIDEALLYAENICNQ